MLLKALELQGFKSFADKTVLDLSSNITGVVGPNGSGKSNITDSLRWLLGERDARNLRGGKVEDLIFAGTDKKPRLGIAQATLYFDNSSKFFPVDYNEVSISRRVSRDGESLFFLNKNEVRLKDVVDFFAKAKLGARGLTIITQGSSDVFIRATPAARKEMIEEILGLKEYQLKKTDAIRKLKNTAVNLETVSASLREIKPHLRFLKRQVARYEERDSLASELKNLEDGFYGRKFRFLKSDLINGRSQAERLDKIILAEEKLYQELSLKLEEVKKSEPLESSNFEETEKQKGVLFARKAEMQKELGRLEARVEFELKEEISSRVDALETLRELRKLAADLKSETDIQTLKVKVDEMLVKIDEVLSGPRQPAKKELSPELKAAQEKIAAEMKKMDAGIKALTEQEEKSRAGFRGFNKLFTESYEKVEAQKKKLDAVASDRVRLQFEIEKNELKISGLKEEIVQAGRTVESLKDLRFVDLEIGEDEAIRRMFKLRGDLAGIGEIDQNLIKEAQETEERFQFLTGQVADLESATKDLKILIKDLDYKIHNDFTEAIKTINGEFSKLIKMVFGGGAAKLVVKAENKNFADVARDENPGMAQAGVERESAAGKFGEAEAEEDKEDATQGVEVEISLPRKRIKGLDVLSGGERTLVSIAVLFALISVSPPPFLVLDEVDAALDEANARRCAEILKEFSKKSQFIVVTHNRATMESADVLYGVTMQSDGTSKLLSLKLESK